MNKVDLADSFYAAARELRARAEHDIGVAGFLERYGDALCEASVKEKTIGPLPGSSPDNGEA